MIAGRCASGGANSNGAGKTTILNAFTWCTFGREIPRNTGSIKRTASSVIREGESQCSVETQYLHEGKPFLRIRRTRRASGGTELWIDGEKAATVSGGQAEIEARLGFSFELFVRTVVFGGDLSSFCRMTAGERSATLERLHGIGNYLAASDAAKSEVRRLSDEVTHLSSEIAARENARDTAKQEFKDTVLGVFANRVKAKRRIVTLRQQASAQLDTLYALTDRRRRLLSELEKVHEDFADRKAAWQSQVSQANRSLQDLNDVLREKTGAKSQVDGQIRQIESQIKKLERDRHPDICPTCRQPWPQSKVVNTKAMHTDVRELQKVYLIRREEETTAAHHVENATRALESLRDREPRPPKAEPALRKVTDEIGEAQSHWNYIAAMLEEARTAFDEQEDLINRRWRHLGDLRLADAETVALRDAAERQAGLYAYWQQGFGRHGLPSVILENTAPALNVTLKTMADYLTDHAYSIWFETTVSDTGKTDFAIAVSNVDGGSSYADLSKGEAVRVDLCVLLAIRQLMQDRAAVDFEQVFIDELADGLDTAGMDAFIRLLRSRKIAEQVFYVSHDETMQDAADQVILVEKTGNESRVIV